MPCLAMSLQPRAPCRGAPRSCIHYVAVLLSPAYPGPLLVRFHFLFSSNFPFCGPVAVLSPPSLPTDKWLSSPSRAYHSAATNRDDNGTMATMWGHEDVTT